MHDEATPEAVAINSFNMVEPIKGGGYLPLPSIHPAIPTIPNQTINDNLIVHVRLTSVGTSFEPAPYSTRAGSAALEAPPKSQATATAWQAKERWEASRRQVEGTNEDSLRRAAEINSEVAGEKIHAKLATNKPTNLQISEDIFFPDKLSCTQL